MLGEEGVKKKVSGYLSYKNEFENYTISLKVIPPTPRIRMGYCNYIAIPIREYYNIPIENMTAVLDTL